MKKTISVIFVSFVFFSLMFSANAYAADSPKFPGIQEKMFSGEELCVDYTFENFDQRYDCTIYRKGDKFAVDTDFLIEEMFTVTIRVAFDEKNVYMYLPKFPFFYFTYDKEIIEDELDADIFATPENVIYIGSGTKEIDGKTYYVDIYEVDGTTVKYGIENDELIFVESYSDEDYNIIFFNEISYSVNDSVFRPPFFAINLSHFLVY